MEINTALVSWQGTAGTYWVEQNILSDFSIDGTQKTWMNFFFFLPGQSMCQISSFKCGGDSYIKSKFRLFYFVDISDNWVATLKRNTNENYNMSFSNRKGFKKSVDTVCQRGCEGNDLVGEHVRCNILSSGYLQLLSWFKMHTLWSRHSTCRNLSTS